MFFFGCLNCCTISCNISFKQIIFISRLGGYPFEASFFLDFFDFFRKTLPPKNIAQRKVRTSKKHSSMLLLATSRTAAQMTSRFRDVENHVETNFSHQQSEIISESPPRHYLLEEATAEAERRRQPRGSLPVKK